MTTMSSSNDSSAALATDPVPEQNLSLDSGQACANCGRFAKRRCTGCIRGDNDQDSIGPPATYYCSKACQRDHWETTHKIQCRLAIDRRQLFRLGSLVQWAFYAATKAMWYDHIMQVMRTRDTEVLDGAQLELWRRKRHDRTDFSIFVEGKFNNIYGEKL
jgi:hypothetical protein